MGPAPAVAAVRSAVRAALAGCDGAVLVACSGGADSLALAAAAAFEAWRAGVPAGLVTVDHGLVPGSARQAARVAAIGYELGLDPVVQVRVEVGRDGGPEAAARRARYDALDAVAQPLAAQVLLGHTLDDQAETVLLGLGRGSGPRSLVGMAAVDGRYLRPFLQLRKATTAAACAALGLDPWCDPQNADPRFQRVRLRREVLPLLDDVLQGGVAEALARTADLLRDDLAALDAEAADVLGRLTTPTARSPLPASPGLGDPPPISVDPPPKSAVDHDADGSRATEPATGRAAGRRSGRIDELDVTLLAGLSRAIRTRVLRGWAARGGAQPLTAERTHALDELVTAWRGQGSVDLPGGVTVCRTSGRLVMYPDPPQRLQE